MGCAALYYFDPLSGVASASSDMTVAVRPARLIALLFTLAVARADDPEVCRSPGSCTASLVQREQTTRTKGAAVEETPQPAGSNSDEGPWCHAGLRLLQAYAQHAASAASEMMAGYRSFAHSHWLMLLLTVLGIAGVVLFIMALFARAKQSPQTAGRPSVAWPFSQARTAMRAARPSRSPPGSQASIPGGEQRKDELVMCPDLLVPTGSECELFLPRLPQATGLEVSVDDHRGVGVFRATVFAHPKEDGTRMSVVSPQEGAFEPPEVFATLKEPRGRPGPELSIYGAEEAKFGVLRRVRKDVYEVAAENRTITATRGTGGRISVVDEQSRLMTVMEPQGPREKHKMRVGPNVDAGLAVVVCLGIELLAMDGF
mmetsp:Transcript_52830/g.98974  ORF Transcript_52830/g.98974 Transcript_52830/m.98974 type:complete len:372 (-) Transcript_52830:84-1199(-)